MGLCEKFDGVLMLFIMKKKKIGFKRNCLLNVLIGNI